MTRSEYRTHELALTYDVAPDETMSEAVVEAVSQVTDVSPIPSSDTAQALDPLYTAIDPDALDMLCGTDDSNPETRVVFPYNGCEVTVHGEGHVAVRELET